MNSAEVLIKFKGDTSDVDKDTKKLTSSMGGLTKSMTLANLASSAITKGLGLMTQNMDRAIQRIDTMDNFPKVMQNFGVSADEASASIKRIDKSVQGLPTSLDQAVAGVQDLFMVTKDLKQSEQLFKAVNDSAMVFANGSTEAVDRFIYGYKQAMSAGKVSAQDFNQMNEAIPGLMSKVAEKMGVTYKELKEGLSNGSISVEQFNNALKSLDTEGVGAMEALEKSAHTATGGIQTSIANMKTAFARGVAGIIKSVDGALQPFGGLTGVITKLGKTGEQAFKKIGDALKVVVPKLIQFGQWVKKNKTWISALVIVLGSMYAAFKLLTIINTIKNAIIGFKLAITLLQTTALLCGGSMSTLTASLSLLNLAFLTSPIFWIITGIIALVAAFVLLWNKCEGFRNFFIGMWNGIVAIFNIVIDFIKNNWQALLLMLLNPFTGAFKLLYDNCEGFRNFINGFVEKIKSFFNNMKNGISNAINNVVSFIKSIPSKISSVPGKIIEFFKNLPSKMANIGLDIVKGIGKGITNGVSWIKNTIKSFVGNVTSFIKKVFKIGSPSKLMENQIGQWIPKGIAVGIEANTDSVYTAMKDLTNGIGLNPQLTGSMQNSFSPNVQVYNNVNVEQDPLGQMVSSIKTFSGGAKNDYNYGSGI